MLKCVIIKGDRGSDVKKHCLIKNGAMPLFLNLRRTGVDYTRVFSAPIRFL